MRLKLQLRGVLVLIILGWAAVYAAALPWMARPRRALLEGLIILCGLLLLGASPGVRRLIARTPRVSLGILLAGLTLWLHSQLRVETRDTFPFVSWHMYGEPRRLPEVVQYLLVFESCPGKAAGNLDAAAALGGARGVRTRASQVYEQLNRTRTAEDSAVVTALLDGLLTGLLVGANDREAGSFCGLALERVAVPVSMVGRAPTPPAKRLRHVTVD